MSSLDKYKKMLSQSTTLPAGTAQGGSGQPSTLLSMHTPRGGVSHGHGCGCAHHHHDHEEEDED